jgi:hypothetical protein
MNVTLAILLGAAAAAGLLLWVLASHPKLSDAGRIIFAAAVLTLLLTLARSGLR